MTAANIDRARTYVACSNAHDLKRILPLFADDAVYTSSRVGAHRGPQAIGDMMAGFFAGFPDVHWSVDEYRPVAGNGVEFNFVMPATAAGTNNSIERPGIEQIFFSDGGLITRLEVEA
jgi:hypothetical protein